MPRFHEPHSTPVRPAPRREPGPSDRGARRIYAIGELARDFGVTLRALRFYEAKGLLVPRKRGTTRLYTLADRARLATILRGKELGFSLRDIRALLASEAAAGDAPALALAPERVAEQIAHLEAQRAEIDRALAGLRGYGAPAVQRAPGVRCPA